MQLTGISLLIHVVVEKNENQWSKKLPRTTAPELRDSLGGNEHYVLPLKSGRCVAKCDRTFSLRWA